MQHERVSLTWMLPLLSIVSTSRSLLLLGSATTQSIPAVLRNGCVLFAGAATLVVAAGR